MLVAGCGGAAAPTLSHDDAARLIALTDRIAKEGGCAQARDIADVSARAIQLVNQGRVPAELQEPLLAGVNSLAADHPTCESPTTTPAAAPLPTQALKPHKRHHDHGKHGRDK